MRYRNLKREEKKTETIYIRFMQRVRVEAEIRLLNITACEYDNDATNLYLHSVFVRVSISIAHIRAFQQKKKLLSAHLSFPLVNVNMCVCALVFRDFCAQFE